MGNLNQIRHWNNLLTVYWRSKQQRAPLQWLKKSMSLDIFVCIYKHWITHRLKMSSSSSGHICLAASMRNPATPKSISPLRYSTTCAREVNHRTIKGVRFYEYSHNVILDYSLQVSCKEKSIIEQLKGFVTTNIRITWYVIIRCKQVAKRNRSSNNHRAASTNIRLMIVHCN